MEFINQLSKSIQHDSKNIDCRVPKSEGFSYGRDEVIKLAENNDGVILINPDNPSGNFIPYEDLISILKHLKKLGKYLVVDESFLDFAEGGFDFSFKYRRSKKIS